MIYTLETPTPPRESHIFESLPGKFGEDTLQKKEGECEEDFRVGRRAWLYDPGAASYTKFVSCPVLSVAGFVVSF